MPIYLPHERIRAGVIYTHALENIQLIGDFYHTDYIGAYHSAGQTPGTNTSTGASTVELAGTSAGFDFNLVGTNIHVPTQNLALVYSNEVRQSQDQFDASTVDLVTGMLIIYYSIFLLLILLKDNLLAPIL